MITKLNNIFLNYVKNIMTIETQHMYRKVCTVDFKHVA